MSIEIILNFRKPRDETRQIAYVSIFGTNSQALHFQVADVPIDLNTDELVQAHLDSRIDELHLVCLKKVWRGADISEFREEDKAELEAFLEWIADGHRNIIGYDEEENPIYEVIANHLHEGRPPPQLAWMEMIENATGLEETKTAIIQMLREQI